MERWSTKQVEGAAPDAASMAAARKLARPGPWSDTGVSERLLWGKCQGSGRTPYQVSVDLTGPAFRCSCPSRKFPCKHALALLLLWAHGTDTVAERSPSDFAQEWADDRAGRAARRAERQDRVTRGGRDAVVDPEAAERRLRSRLQLMDSGIDELALWLADLVRAGLAAARRQPLTWWDATARRLVDAQLPGLADQVRGLGTTVNRGEDWAEPLLSALGRLWAVTRAWQRRDQLGPDAMGDLRAVLGWAVPGEEVRAADRVTDIWLVLGTHRTDAGRIAEQRTWLLGERTEELLLVLDFAAGGQPLPVAHLTGARLRADVSRYPGRAVRRALFATDPEVVGASARLPVGADLARAQQQLADALARNPWTPRVPVLLHDARLHVHGTAPAVRVVDPSGRWLPVSGDVDPWTVLARTGGEPVELFGELEDGRVRVLSASGITGLEQVVPA
jgi:hypothetical protein